MSTRPVLLAPPVTFWRRAAAHAIDLVIGLTALLIPVGLLSETGLGDDAVGVAFLLAVAVLLPLLWALLTAAGGTPGRLLLGLRVVRVADGRRATLGDSLRRELVGRTLVIYPLLLCAGAGLLGYLWGTRDARGQCWHDRLGGTTVLHVRGRPLVAAGPVGPRFAPRVALAPGGAAYPSWWERFGAWIVDQSLVVTIVLTVMTSVGVALGALRADDVDPDPTRVAIFLVTFLVLELVATSLYGAICIGWREQTLGKHALGLVVRALDGSRAGYGRAFNRELVGRVIVEGIAGILVGWIAPVASGLSAASDGRRQTWHDKIGQTIVVRDAAHVEPFRRRSAAAEDAAAPADDAAVAAEPAPVWPT